MTLLENKLYFFVLIVRSSIYFISKITWL